MNLVGGRYIKIGKLGLKSARNLWKLGVHKSLVMWKNRISKGGWTPDTIDDAILKGSRRKAKNHVNPNNSATRYQYKDKSVVRDDKTKELLHVGEKGYRYSHHDLP